MTTATASWKEQVAEIKQKAGVSFYESRLRRFTREGREYRAECPKHHDEHPSFTVYQRDGVWLWKCFPCNAGGDVFEFVKWLDGTSFSEAVKVLAAKIGYELETEEQPSFNYDPAMAAARLPEVLDYLLKRGISKETAEKYKVGAADFPGLGLAVVMPYGNTGAAKIRAVEPTGKKKFRHLPGHPTDEFLYGIEGLDAGELFYDDRVFIAESELDALMLVSHGLNAVSVSSATAVVNKDGGLKIKPEHLAAAQEADKVFLALDMDDPGQKCAAEFERVLPSYKTFRLMWPFEKGAPGLKGCKDIGELYAADPATFLERFETLVDAALNRPPAWRTLFKSYSEMEPGDIRFLAEGIMPEGVTFFGGLPGSGKTFLALSLAKALVTGKPFLSVYPTMGPCNVLYLVPEAGEKSFRKRMETVRITDNPRFLCRTARQGSIPLNEPLLLQAVKELKPVIFLDTAIRFLSGTDENDAGQVAKNLGDAIIGLIQAGAVGVVGIHHSTKASAKKDVPDLESTLRGSGDIAALADAAYGLKCKDAHNLLVEVHCVKARDIEPPRPFLIQGRPYLDERGDFAVLVGEWQEEVNRLSEAIAANPRISYRELTRVTRIGKNRIATVAANAGWQKQGEIWVSTKKEGLMTVPDLLM